MAPAVLPPIVGGRLLAVAAKTIIDPIWPAVERIDHAIRPHIGAWIEIRRPVIVQVDLIDRPDMPVMVMVSDVHVGISSE